MVNLSQNASACECKEPDSPLNTLAKSTAVFSGKVVEITKNPSDYTITVKFDVHRTWKGISEKEVDVVTAIDGGGCGYNFVMGETYLVYASGTHSLYTGSCSRNSLFVDAYEDLAQLGVGNIIKEELSLSKQLDLAKEAIECTGGPGTLCGEGKVMHDKQQDYENFLLTIEIGVPIIVGSVASLIILKNHSKKSKSRTN